MSSSNNSDKDSGKSTKDSKDPAFRNNAGNNLNKNPAVKGITVDYSRRFDTPPEPRSKFMNENSFTIIFNFNIYF